MKILNNKTPQQIISEQKSFTDQVHAVLLITEHGDQPNGLGSSINLSKNKKLKKVIEEIYDALLEEKLQTNETLFEKINEIIKNKNFEGIEILKTNLNFAFNTLNNESKELKRFPETEKQSSKTKDPINDFLKVFSGIGGKSEFYSFIGFKKIQKSNQKRKTNHSGSLKHSNPWLMKGLPPLLSPSNGQKKLSEEFETHSFISKIWNNNNEISKIRHTYQSYGSTNLNEKPNKENLFILIKFFENSISLDSVSLDDLLKKK